MHEAYDTEISTFPEYTNATSRLGIIGGGQLARMTALAALPLGCEVSVLETNPLSPAAQLVRQPSIGDWSDNVLLRRFAAGTTVVTLENEFVPASALRTIEEAGHAVYPSADCMAITQDKFVQKQTLVRHGLPVPACRSVASPDDVLKAGAELGWPLVLKTRRNGYDGRGNFTLHAAADVPVGWRHLGGDEHELFVEAFCRFTKELAVIVTHGRNGETATYPVVETTQHNHICHVVQAPAEIPAELAARATELAVRAVAAVGGVGSFGVELFLVAPDQLAINELAPRVHNSGHYTIEACECSQFENHIRAVLGWPLGSTRMVAPAAAMVNLLGEQKTLAKPRGLLRALAIPGAHVHFYGKAMSGPGRKLGHVTALGATPAEALSTAQSAAQSIRFGIFP